MHRSEMLHKIDDTLNNKTRAYINRFPQEILLISWFISVFFWIYTAATWANDLSVIHDLDVELIPAEKKLLGWDQMKIWPGSQNTLSFLLSEKVVQLDIRVNGSPRKFVRRQELIDVVLRPDEQNDTVMVSVRYAGIFNDPFPTQPVNMDNPGFGVSGTISEKGSFLSEGSRWYPELKGGRTVYNLKVRAPAGIISITAGRSMGIFSKHGKTISIWQIDYPVEGLSLSASRYVVQEKKLANVTIATYFLSPDPRLSNAYLDATEHYLSLYSDLFGPYPFNKFAVVENFFPTGFGFPSYTLLGGRVLRLPFIIRTSLGHEIAHCWWGNGVHVDYARGNWSEALTTYISDYLPSENISETEAKNYRQQILRNFATLVKPQTDFALNRFVGRYDPITKTIGYDKGAMVFHMLRKMMGEEAFWGALRDIYGQQLFKKTSWQDLQQFFENRAKRPLDEFFKQWVYRKGAPSLYLDKIKTEYSGNKWKIRGRIVQTKPYYRMPLTLRLESGNQPISKNVNLNADPSTPFVVDSKVPPQRLILDPDVDVMRRLSDAEIPPSINSLKSSPSVIFLVSDKMEPGIKAVAESLALSLGIKKYTIVSDSNVSKVQIDANDLIIMGLPKQKELFRRMPDQAIIYDKGFSLNHNIYDRNSSVFFGVFAHPYTDGRVAALFWPPLSSHAELAARKMTHYGKYSFLAFEEGINKEKGFWQINESPLEYRWEKPTEN